jgi:hypothetical protein
VNRISLETNFCVRNRQVYSGFDLERVHGIYIPPQNYRINRKFHGLFGPIPELWFYFLLLSVIVREIVILFLLQKEKTIVMNIFIIKKSIVN